MKKLLVAALATMMTQQALATIWVQIGEDNDGNKGYLDVDSIRQDYLTDGTPVMTAWRQIDYKQAQDAGDGKKYWSHKDFYYFDCHARKSAIEYFVTYDKQGGVLASSNNPAFNRHSSANWQKAIDTTDATLLITVCAYAD